MIDFASQIPVVTNNAHFDEGFSWGRLTYQEVCEETLPTYEEITELIKQELSPENVEWEKRLHAGMQWEPIPYEKRLGLVAGFLAEYADAITASCVQESSKIIPLRRA